MDNGRAERLGPDAWVDAAYDAFRNGGVDAVRVEPLARTLKITRGSFYWHFADRAALLRAVLERWVSRDTEAVIAQNEAAGGDAVMRLTRLLSTCAADDGRLEMSVRAFAARDEAARTILAAVDARRIDYLAALVEEAGVRVGAQERARVAYLAWLGSYADTSSADARERDMMCLAQMMLMRAEGSR